jgi:hypothetical protein
MDFRIWANVRQMAGRFFVTVSAQSVEDPDRTGGVETDEGGSLEEAHVIRERLVTQLQDKLRRRGHRVVELHKE